MSRAKPFAVAGLVLAGGALVASRMSDFKTPGVRNIEERHMAAGGGINATPSHASKLGDKASDVGPALQEKGMGSKYFNDRFGDQKLEPSAANKAWNQTKHSQDSNVH